MREPRREPQFGERAAAELAVQVVPPRPPPGGLRVPAEPVPAVCEEERRGLAVESDALGVGFRQRREGVLKANEGAPRRVERGVVFVKASRPA